MALNAGAECWYPTGTGTASGQGQRGDSSVKQRTTAPVVSTANYDIYTMPPSQKLSWAEEESELSDTPRGNKKRPNNKRSAGKSRQQRSSSESSSSSGDIMASDPGSSRSHHHRRRRKQSQKESELAAEPAAEYCATLSSTTDELVPLSRSAASEINLLLLGMGV